MYIWVKYVNKSKFLILKAYVGISGYFKAATKLWKLIPYIFVNYFWIFFFNIHN